MPKLGIFFLFFIYSHAVQAKTIFVFNKKKQPVSNVKVSYSYLPYDSLKTKYITDDNGMVKLPESDKRGLYFIHPKYNPAYLDGLQLKENDTIILTPSFLMNPLTIKEKRFDHSKGIFPTMETEKSIEKMNPGTAADLLNQSGEVYIQKSQLGGGSPMIRGFSANSVLIVVDGVRMNNAIYRSGNLQNIISVDPYYLQSANVIFGPGSLTYGRDALGGVMDFSTKGGKWGRDSAFKVRGSVLGKYGTAANEKTGHVDFNIYNQKISSTTSFSYTSFDDLKMGNKDSEDFIRKKYASNNNGIDIEIINSDPLVQKGSGFDNYQFLQKLEYKASEDMILSYGFYYSSTTDIPRYDRLIQETDNTLRYSEWNYGPQTWSMNRIGIQYTKENNLFDQFDLVLAIQDYSESRINRNFGSSARNTREEKVNVTTLNLDFEKVLEQDITIYYGAELNSNLISSNGEALNILTDAATFISTRYPDNSNWNSEAIYVMSKKNYDSASIFGGVRGNFVQIEGTLDTKYFPFPVTSINNNLVNVNGSIGYSQKLKKEWSIFTNLSSAFRAPNMDDIGKVFDSEPGNLIIPNPELKPETVYSADFAIGKKVKKEFKFQTSVFASYLNNAMVRKNTTLNGSDSIMYNGTLSAVSHLSNEEIAIIYGFQVVLEKKMFKKLFLGGTFNYMKGETSKQESLRHVSPTFGKVYAKWDTKKITTEINMFANGTMTYNNLAPSERNKAHLYSVDENGNPFSKSWYTLNAALSYSPNKNVIINGSIENILDQAYRSYSSGIAAPGRNFLLSLKYKFL